ncbi:hypothetical protein KCU94_g5477, partial [Aureobasidium melanogenum]
EILENVSKKMEPVVTGLEKEINDSVQGSINLIKAQIEQRKADIEKPTSARSASSKITSSITKPSNRWRSSSLERLTSALQRSTVMDMIGSLRALLGGRQRTRRLRARFASSSGWWRIEIGLILDEQPLAS